MREYELIISEAFKNGLSPEHNIPDNSQLLSEALGFRCGKYHIECYPQGTNPLPAAVDMHYNWPFPQFIPGEGYNFLIIRDLVNHTDFIYSISDDMGTVTLIFPLDELSYGVGTLMEVADFGEYAMMVNGVVRVFWNVAGAWNASFATATIPLMRTICNFNGQAVGGAVTSAWHDCDETFYIWSKIGEMDFTPDRRNEAGYRRCPFGGEVYHTRPFGNDYVVGYSSKGITRIFPVSSPAATFGFEEMFNIGPINRGAMAAGRDRQVFVGPDYILRSVENVGQLSFKLGVKDLGYQRYMEDLAGEDIIVSYDKTLNDFYIGTSTKTFLLSPTGLTEVPQHPSAVWRHGADLCMLPDTVDDFQHLVTTEIFDFGYRGQKTVQLIETDASAVEGPYAAADSAFNYTDGFTGSFVPINNEGVATVIAAGAFFRFSLRFNGFYPLSRLGYMKVRYKMTDLRSIRGVYAPPPRGQNAN